MLISLDEAKLYLRLDHDEDDDFILTLINAAEELCADVARIPAEEIPEKNSSNVRVAMLYTIAYLYEHREEADHHDLALTLRALLFGIREAAF